MNATRTCPECGKPVTPSGLQGLCPECLIRVGMAAQTGEEEPARTRAAPPRQQLPSSPAEIARLFPQLEILECLGCGGMGTVYKARQPRLDRLVALKILTPDRAEETGDPRFAERFEREARALAKLNHPHIVTMYEFGQVEGRPYFIMEYVDGLNLRQLEQAGKLTPREALQVVPQICEALQFAHDEGIVHRDIKPENILIDKKGRVKIADFGIAKILGRESRAPALTEGHQIIGTPHYMAPEQVEKPQAVDHRADIYSLGVVFYEMLTGELPLGKFAPPSGKVHVDVRLDEVVLRALEKEPELRYQQASQVKSDVETIVASGSEAAAAVPGQAASGGPPTNKSPLARIVEIASGTTFTSRLALRLIDISTLGFLAGLAFLGYVPLPGWQRCFGFSGFAGFFGLIGVAFLIEHAARRKSKGPPSGPGSSTSTPEGERIRRRVTWPAIGLLVIGILSWVGIALFVLLPGAGPSDGLRPVLLLLAPLAAMLVVLLRRELRSAFKANHPRSLPTGRRGWARTLVWGTLLVATLTTIVIVLIQARARRPESPNLTVSRTVTEAAFGPVMERVLPFEAPCRQKYFQFHTGKIIAIGNGPGDTSDHAEDYRRAEETGGLDASALGWKDGIQLAGKGCIFTQEKASSWDALTAQQAVQRLQHATWIAGVIEIEKKDLPATYLFKTARGECGILQILGLAADPLGWNRLGMKFRYKLVSSAPTS